jgi:hypothetical protein
MTSFFHLHNLYTRNTTHTISISCTISTSFFHITTIILHHPYSTTSISFFFFRESSSHHVGGPAPSPT